MYNPIQKEMYIEHLVSNSKARDKAGFEKQLFNFFDRIDNVEQEFGKDFAMFSFNEMKVSLSVICRRSTRYQDTTLSRLRSYLDWATKNNLSVDSENRLVGFSSKDINISISYKMSMLRDEIQLRDYLDIVLPPVEDDTIYNMHRVAIHLIFNGLTLEETVQLKKEHIDFEKKTIKINSKVLNISNICSSLIEYLISMDAYTAETKRGDKLYTRSLTKEDSEYILIKTKNNNNNSMVEYLRSKLSEDFRLVKEHFDYLLSISPTDIFVSGIFSRIYEKEKVTREIDLSEYIKKQEYLETFNNAINSNIEDLNNEYHSWKKAFDLT